MAEILDILQTINNTPSPGGIDERQDFTINLLVNDVLINPPAGIQSLGYTRLRSSTTNFYKLAKQDNFIIQSCGLILPYNFVESTVNAVLWLAWSQDNGVTLNNLTQFGAAGRLRLPFTNYECPINIYVPFPHNDKISLYFYIDELRVSMLGVPAVLAGNIPVSVFLKISHNLDMTT